MLAKKGEKKIEIVTAPENPFSRGSAVANTAYRSIGDSYEFRVMDAISQVEQEFYTAAVQQVTDNGVTYSDGSVDDLLGNAARFRDGTRLSPNQTAPLEYAVGKRWISRFTVTFPDGTISNNEIEGRIVAREKITVPAGTFDCFRQVNRSYGVSRRDVIQINSNHWRDPDHVRPIVLREEIRRTQGRVVFAQRRELVAYKQA
ncbi:MAG: hypothetical protein EXR27_11935 [Betaproteobacteria bacterium]|nr:hypothetical protein [Betaproteobacteria bacterium]